MLKLLFFFLILSSVFSCSSLPKGASLPSGVELTGKKLQNCFEKNYCVVKEEEKIGLYDIYNKEWILKPIYNGWRSSQEHGGTYKVNLLRFYINKLKPGNVAHMLVLANPNANKTVFPFFIKIKLNKAVGRYEGVDYLPEENVFKLSYWFSTPERYNQPLYQQLKGVRYIRLDGKEGSSFDNHEFWLAQSSIKAIPVKHSFYKDLWRFKTSKNDIYPDTVNKPESPVEIIGYRKASMDNLFIVVGKNKKNNAPVYGLIDREAGELLPMNFDKIEQFYFYRGSAGEILKTRRSGETTFYHVNRFAGGVGPRMKIWSQDKDARIAQQKAKKIWDEKSTRHWAEQKKHLAESKKKWAKKRSEKDEASYKFFFSNTPEASLEKKKKGFCSSNFGDTYLRHASCMSRVGKEIGRVRVTNREGKRRSEQLQAASDLEKSRAYGARLDAQRKAGAAKIDRDISARNARQRQEAKDRKWKKKIDYIKGNSLNRPDDY